MEYYYRIFQTKPNESEEDLEKRITVIKNQLPYLPLWKNDLYKNYITTVNTGPKSDTMTNKKSSPSKTPTSETEVS